MWVMKTVRVAEECAREIWSIGIIFGIKRSMRRSRDVKAMVNFWNSSGGMSGGKLSSFPILRKPTYSDNTVSLVVLHDGRESRPSQASRSLNIPHKPTPLHYQGNCELCNYRAVLWASNEEFLSTDSQRFTCDPHLDIDQPLMAKVYPPSGRERRTRCWQGNEEQHSNSC